MCLFCCFSVHVRFKWGKSCRAFEAEVQLPYQRLNKCDYELTLTCSWPVLFSSIRVRLTCFCRVLFGCFLTADRFCQKWLRWICQVVEADQSFVFFVSLFEEKKSFTPEIKDEKDWKDSFFCWWCFFFFLGYLCLMTWMDYRPPARTFKNLNYSWTELLAINIVSIYILILAVCLIFHNKVYKNLRLPHYYWACLYHLVTKTLEMEQLSTKVISCA